MTNKATVRAIENLGSEFLHSLCQERPPDSQSDSLGKSGYADSREPSGSAGNQVDIQEGASTTETDPLLPFGIQQMMRLSPATCSCGKGRLLTRRCRCRRGLAPSGAQ